MGGQVLGGGVIVAVAVGLWLVYLLPSWHSRHQYEAAERNALRLGRAMRVLAETSEAPEEVRLELNARTALAQQRLAKRVEAERASASLEMARAELALAREKARVDAATAKELSRLEADVAREQAQAAAEQARAEAEAARERARAEAETARADAAAARERARAQAAAARALPAARRARARRRARLVTTIIGFAGLLVAGWGAVELVLWGAQTLLWVGGAVVAASGLLLHRMARVRSRGVAAAAVAPEVRQVATAHMQDVSLVDERAWTPRELPRPLTASTGSRAAVALDAAAAHEALRQAALEESMRERAERAAPPSIVAARAARTFTGTAASADADIEAHVRDLLLRRASGQ
ncbi:large exoprotein [Microbacterium sp. zg.Y625]|uniref:large exoprotein n=1 Tax=Microbacterium jiangjiandongii TaxID=3049071 RepID=UPI00214C7B82|nr:MULTISPECIES: large exoprotein [unclassified Microbacterium]MCR2791635.1 large exoprotein [Microbacterium sp. zg.Y625]WIM24457.1 large exoprotein [Microbacterium sp. zg-Y625]